MKVAVIGGCGFIGLHVCEHLAKRGFSVRIIGRCSHSHAHQVTEQKGERMELREANVLDEVSLKRALTDVDAIMHYAALINVDQSIQTPRPFFEFNVLGTMNVLEIARRMGIPIVYKSTCEVFGNVPAPMIADEDYRPMPRSPYAVSKLCAERYCLAYQATYGIPLVIARGFNTFGPRQSSEKYGAVIPKFIMSTLSGSQPQIYGDGFQERDYVYVRDVADADVAILEALVEQKIPSGEVFNVCTGETKSILRIAKDVIALCGMDGKIQPAFISARPGEVRRNVGSYDKIRKQLSWSPKTSFEQGLAETVDYYRGLIPALRASA